MNRQTTSGPTGFARVRFLLELRHRNPAARLISTLLAFAISALLVVGSGAAYADDATPTDPSTTSDTTTSDTTTTDTTATTTTGTVDPVADPAATSSDPAPSPDPAPAPASSPKKTTAKTTTTSALAVVPLQALLFPLSDTGNFEIDGDTVNGNNSGDDFTNADLVTESYRDAQGYQGTNKLQNDPSGWAGTQVATEKMDMVKLWVRTILSGPRSAFGIQRDAANGTTAYYFEYNHLPNLSGDVAKPDRSPNDVMFGFTQSGNNAGNKLSFDRAYVYALDGSPTWNDPDTDCTLVLGSNPAGGWCTLDTANGVFYSATSDGSGNGAAGTYPEGIFAEGIVDFSKLTFPQGSCLGALGHLNVRSQSSLEWTSAMQDFAVADVNVPSTCGSLTVLKKGPSGDTLLPGAIFSIVDDPRPGKTGTYKVFDGTQAQLDAINASSDPAPTGTVADGSANGKIEVDNAEPGTYTVTELRAPAGYLLPADRDQVVTVGAVGSDDPRNPEITFRDPVAWSPLTAKKTAHGDYDATFTWTITKGVRYGSDAYAASASKDSANTTESFDWKVSIGEGTRTESNHAVTGAITISNPNSSAVVATVSESLTGCTIYDPADTTEPLTPLADASPDAGFQVSVPANGGGSGTAYQYKCLQSDTSATSNTATITVDRAAYPRNQADVDAGAGTYTAGVTAGAGNTLSPSITWTEHNPDGTKVITVTDVLQGTATTHSGSGAPWTHTWGDHADTTWNATTSKYEHVYSSPVTATAGTCASVTNVATITDTGQSATATASHCAGVNLTVSKNRTLHLTRTYLWDIDKTLTSDAQMVSGQSASYSVTVSRGAGDGYEDSGWSMDGSITVTNQNAWPVTLTGVTDSYDGDNDGSNSCEITGSKADANAAADADINYDVPANGSYLYTYVCTFDAKPDYDGTNTATATWDASAAHTASGTASGTAGVTSAAWALAATPVNKVITVTDSVYAGGTGTGGHTLGTVDWDDAPTTFTYSIPWTAPAGECETKPNTATIVETGQDDSAEVEVCNPLGLSISKTATGDFTRTYPWTIEKFINGDQTSQEVQIDTYEHTFAWKVLVTPGALVDSGWTVHGTITVTNDNTDSDIAPIAIGTLVDDPSGSGEQCTLDKGLPDHALVSGESYEVGYSCTLTGKSTTNKATVTWANGGSADTGNVNVDWNEPTEVDKTIDVYDNKVDLPSGEKLGTATWNAEGTPTIFDYEKTLSVPESTAGSCAPDFVNTAWLGGDGSEPTDLNDSTTARICVNAGTWEVSKVNVDGDGPVPTDSDVTYRLTAHKTGGANPKDVVLYDDLSDIAPYVELPTLADLQAAAPTGTTVELTGNLITWTIAELGDTDETLEFTVHVNADAYGIDLPNLVTSPGSDNCPDAETAGEECTTDNDTPHYTLAKDSDAGAKVMPPYLGAQGTLITYTLTVHNDSDAPINATTMPGETVTDDLSDVLDNADWVGNVTPSGQAERVGNTLTWTLPEIPVDGTVTLTYQVRVAGDQWDETLTNVAHEGPGGDCLAVEAVLVAVVNPNCTTTTATPPYAQIQVLKIDSVTNKPLGGAEFRLSHNGVTLETKVSNANGLVTFATKLQPGTFRVTETKAPSGYLMPTSGTTRDVTIGADDLDNGVPPVKITFADPPKPVVEPPVVEPPPPSSLPNTGGPDAWLMVAGLVLLLGGGTLVAGGRLRRRRS